MHVCEVRPRKDKRGVDLLSDALPFGRILPWNLKLFIGQFLCSAVTD